MFSRDDPTARIGDARRHRPLVRVNSNNVARAVRRDQHARRTRPPSPAGHICSTLHWYGYGGPGRQRPGGDRRFARSTLLSGQTGSRNHGPRSTLLTQDPTKGSRHYSGQTPVRSSTLTRTVARVRANPISTPGHYGGPALGVSKGSALPAQAAGEVFALRIAPSARGAQSRRGAPMPDGIRWVGLDVHGHESTIAIFDQGTGELTTRRVVGRPHELMPWLGGGPRPARMVYEAGPTGYGLARRARAESIELVVCAPGRADRALTERVKTDKRDAIRLARRLAAGELTLVTVPSVEHEQLRDLVRCREDIRGDLMRARHRLGKFLLRREIYYEGPATAWTQ